MTSTILQVLRDARKQDPTFWKERMGQTSNLRISTDVKEDSKPFCTAGKRYRSLLAQKGYSAVDDELDQELVTTLRDGIKALHQQGLPATFIMLFDETWRLAESSLDLMRESCHPKNKPNFDMLAWYIPPGGAGFSPHRDRQPENVDSAFHSVDDDDDSSAPDPKFVTHWIALSEAKPSNSCLFVIPRENDPGYHKGDTEDQDPLQRALPDKVAYQSIQAIPRQPGQSLLFSHRLIHWGSKSDDTHENPRIAISFVCGDPEFEAPLLVKSPFSGKELPSLEIRLLLVCAQLIIYYQRFDLKREEINACYSFCKERQEHLGEDYRKKVFVEFVKAMKETATEGELAQADDKAPNNDACDEEEDYEDAMMEEMLQAENEGYGEFEDDFDQLDDEADTNAFKAGEDAESEDDDDDEEEEVVDLFGKRALEDKDSELSRKVRKLL